MKIIKSPKFKTAGIDFEYRNTAKRIGDIDRQIMQIRQQLMNLPENSPEKEQLQEEINTLQSRKQIMQQNFNQMRYDKKEEEERNPDYEQKN